MNINQVIFKRANWNIKITCNCQLFPQNEAQKRVDFDKILFLFIIAVDNSSKNKWKFFLRSSKLVDGKSCRWSKSDRHCVFRVIPFVMWTGLTSPLREFCVHTRTHTNVNWYSYLHSIHKVRTYVARSTWTGCPLWNAEVAPVSTRGSFLSHPLFIYARPRQPRRYFPSCWN